MQLHTIFTVSLANAWGDIKKRWRNLFVKTYAGVTMKRWLKAYRISDYNSKLRRLFMGSKNAKQN
jgi:hypothetical protein